MRLAGGVTQRRACTLMNVARSGLVYAHKMPVKYGPIIRAMRHYTAQYPPVRGQTGADFFALRWHCVGTRPGGKDLGSCGAAGAL